MREGVDFVLSLLPGVAGLPILCEIQGPGCGHAVVFACSGDDIVGWVVCVFDLIEEAFHLRRGDGYPEGVYVF